MSVFLALFFLNLVFALGATMIFGDEMTADNTKDLEVMIGDLIRDVAGLRGQLRTRGT